ncbi:MAG: hypothetical protein ACI4UE_04360 [Candidatus Scatovivens sp.]
MIEKIKEKFKNNKIEKLVSFLVILVITLIIINKILNEDDKNKKENLTNTTQLVTTDNENNDVDNLEEKLETILSQIQGVGKVNVLITYSESSSINPLYNENSSSSTTEENVNSDTTKVTQTQSTSKEILTDSSSNPIIQKTTYPKIEGSIIIAEGASSAEVKTSIISAVEAATGLASHKIQVFEMKK